MEKPINWLGALYVAFDIREVIRFLLTHQARGLRGASVPTKARLTYFQDQSLTLELQYKAEDTWTRCFELNAEDANIAIPSVAYLGLSAETGELSDNHDIVSLKTQNLYSVGGPPRTNRGSSSSSSRDKAQVKSAKTEEGGSWGWFLFKAVLLLVAVAGGYVGWTAYRAKTRYSRF